MQTMISYVSYILMIEILKKISFKLQTGIIYVSLIYGKRNTVEIFEM